MAGKTLQEKGITCPADTEPVLAAVGHMPGIASFPGIRFRKKFGAESKSAEAEIYLDGKAMSPAARHSAVGGLRAVAKTILQEPAVGHPCRLWHQVRSRTLETSRKAGKRVRGGRGRVRHP
ncbi:MAG: hypothetical protein LBG06_02500 [Deltaproteobacteria bacterium]|jgi:hypothetical protein|nr:hypothetical protein [Deltaproteobacteria bacterium]